MRSGRIRLQKVLAAAGLGSRRRCEAFIREGRITINGLPVTRPGILADPHRDRILIDGNPIPDPSRPKVYFLLNKPRGYLCTLSDPRGRPTVRDLLPEVRERVFPVGRLDWDTEGLLILTNDGDLAQKVAHPSRGCRKYYRARVRGSFSERDLRKLESGAVRLEGRRCRPIGIRLLRKGRNSWYELVLREGRKNQIRNLFLMLGHPVERLRRVGIGAIRDSGLPLGAYRRLAVREIRGLLRGEDPEGSPPRGRGPPRGLPLRKSSGNIA